MRLWALRWFDFPEIDSGGLFRQIQCGNRLERDEVDHFQRSRLGADPLDGDEGIKVVGRNGHSVHDLTVGEAARVTVPSLSRRWKRNALAYSWRYVVYGLVSRP